MRRLSVSICLLVTLLAIGPRAETPKLTIVVKSGTPIEQRKKEQIERLAAKYDLKKFTETRDIAIEQGAVAHSKPVHSRRFQPSRRRDPAARRIPISISPSSHWSGRLSKS